MLVSCRTFIPDGIESIADNKTRTVYDNNGNEYNNVTNIIFYDGFIDCKIGNRYVTVYEPYTIIVE